MRLKVSEAFELAMLICLVDAPIYLLLHTLIDHIRVDVGLWSSVSVAVSYLTYRVILFQLPLQVLFMGGGFRWRIAPVPLVAAISAALAQGVVSLIVYRDIGAVAGDYYVGSEAGFIGEALYVITSAATAGVVLALYVRKHRKAFGGA